MFLCCCMLMSALSVVVQNSSANLVLYNVEVRLCMFLIFCEVLILLLFDVDSFA